MKGRRLLFPPVWLTVLLTCVSAAGLVVVFLRGWEETLPAYGLYALSCYALTVACAALWVRAPHWAARLRARRQALPEKWLRDGPLLFSLAMNGLFVLVNVLIWALRGSWWYLVLAGYYAILMAVRLLLARGLHAPAQAQWRYVRRCAVTLLMVNLSLTAVVLMVLYVGKGFAYEGVLIYAVAAYTFYSVIHAVIALVKRRRCVHPVETAAQTVSLTAALVSLLALETAMLSQFGMQMPDHTQYLFVALTGAGVGLTIVSMSVWMLRAARRALAVSDK